jgi:nucleoside-diphosphate-sugar epimerase
MKLVNGGLHRRCYTYIDDAIQCILRIVDNHEGVCNRQVFNIGTPYNEIFIRGLAEMMREIYSEKFMKPGQQLPDIILVSSDEFYGEGYEDSDRRIPDISKARNLLGWEPEWKLRDLLEKTMQYYITEYMDYYRAHGRSDNCTHDIVHKALEVIP